MIIDLEKERAKFLRGLLKLLKQRGERNFETETIAKQIADLWVRWLQVYNEIGEATSDTIPRLVDALYKIDLMISQKLNLLKVTPEMRRKVKFVSANKIMKERKKLVEKLGGKCQICGYDKKECLEIHHIFPEKRASSPVILLCPNCHKEIHKGLLKIELKNEKP